MGKCLSCRKSQEKAGEDAAKEPVKNEVSDSKLTNQKTSNGQIDANHANEATKKQATSDGTSTGDPKIESSSTEIEAKSVKVVKTVRITEGKTSEAIAVEQQNSDQPKVQSTKPDDIDIDLHDPAVENAATTIQAGFRGHRTRKQLASSKGEEQDRANDVDIDLNDPEVNNAALKIQASFRGHLTRKNLQDK